MSAPDPLLATCLSEAIHSPGAIQDWGALLVAGPADLVVRHASANLGVFLGIRGEDALGRDLRDLIGQNAVAEVLAGAPEEDPGAVVARLPPQAPGLPPLALSAHWLGGKIYVEIEAAARRGAGGTRLHSRRTIQALRAATSSSELFRCAAAELRKATGFDRVMVYRFDTDCHGEVIADDCADDMESLLGLHYPAEDIPPQAWQIFARLLVRVITDANAARVTLLGGEGAGPQPDLSLCALRAPSLCHTEYLRNLGSQATATVALNVDGALWGILACHHRSGAVLSPEQRALCELIGQVTALMVVTLRDAEARAAAVESSARLLGMSARLAAQRDDPESLAAALAAEDRELLQLCEADGAIVRLGGNTFACGATPGEAAANNALLDALFAHAHGSPSPTGTNSSGIVTAGVFSCDSLGALLGSDRMPAGCQAAGALLLQFDRKTGDAVLWLRHEQARTVKWGGDPHHSMRFDEARGQLVPRSSFAVWRQEVRGRSLPWLPAHINAARGLRTRIDKLLAGYSESMRLAREAAERATRAKSEFLATMSHEIRSPMSGLMGVLELLRGTDLDAEQSRMAAMIHGSASMLLAVLNDILDFSKIEAGALSIAPEPVALRGLLQGVVQPHSVAAAPKKLRIRLDVDTGVPDRVVSDPLRLRQIIGNLMSNAVKFTAAGAVHLHVDVAHVDRVGEMLRFRVRDTGIGIEKEVIGRLFAPFMQADGSTTRNFGGTGLGLCISRQLAHLLGGDLTVASQSGVGSEFTFTMPLTVCADEAPDGAGGVQGLHPSDSVSSPAGAALSAGAFPAPALSAGRRVLVVDDDATIRWLSQRQLEKLGFVADTVEDGETGLRSLQSGMYDLLLTDCHMPRMNGVSLTLAVRQSADPALGSIPIIGLTADVTEAQRTLCQEAGMNELAIKPLTVERLSQLLQRHLPAPMGVPAGDAPEAAAMPSLSAAVAGGPADFQDACFDTQIYLSIFMPGEADGAVWLTEWMATARDDTRELGGLLAKVPGCDLPREHINTVAHRLAGSAFSVGAMRLGAAARALEGGALHHAEADLRGLYTALSREFAAAERAISAFVATGELAVRGA